jgi:hypothetical protein
VCVEREGTEARRNIEESSREVLSDRGWDAGQRLSEAVQKGGWVVVLMPWLELTTNLLCRVRTTTTMSSELVLGLSHSQGTR